jgi:hypothetical protein
MYKSGIVCCDKTAALERRKAFIASTADGTKFDSHANAFTMHL